MNDMTDRFSAAKLTKLERYVFTHRDQPSYQIATDLNRSVAAIDSTLARAERKLAALDAPVTVNFKVVARSDNRNSFGLRQYVAVDSKGRGIQFCASHCYADILDPMPVVQMQQVRGVLDWSSLRVIVNDTPTASHRTPVSVELPNELKVLAPPDVVRAAWGALASGNVG